MRDRERMVASHVCLDIYTWCRDTLMDKSEGEGSFYYY